MTWTVSDEETGEETGRCSVCGYTCVRRPASAQEESGGIRLFGTDLTFPPSILMWLLCALLPVDIVLLIAHAIRVAGMDEEEYDY